MMLVVVVKTPQTVFQILLQILKSSIAATNGVSPLLSFNTELTFHSSQAFSDIKMTSPKKLVQ